ncbi:MAG: GAF domain-containing protein [Gemmatimonas sp.]|nr:GAF domain-containing protein [Gemmatimonas sp.]
MESSDLERLGRLMLEERPGASPLEVLLRVMPAGALLAEAPDGRIVLANPQMEKVLRMELEAGTAAPALKGFHDDGTEYTPEEWPLVRALSRGEAVSDEEIELVRGDGSHAVVRASATPLCDESGEVVGAVLTCLDISEQRRRYTSRKFISDAGALLSSSLDPVTTLRNIARLAVPTLADWCTIDLIDSEGQIERVAVEHIDRRKARAATELAKRHPPSQTAPVGVAKAIRRGKSELIRDVTSTFLDELAQGPRHRKLLEELGIRSLMMVPLIARSGPLGAITFVSAESGRLYSLEELEMAEELAARAALAIENSRLFHESQAASEAKSDFLAVMSHELRTPLTAIIGYAELLQLGVPEPVTSRQHEQAERIEVSARHLLQLIEEILTLVTLDSGESKLRNERVDVIELLHRASSIIEPMARFKDLPVRVGYPQGETLLHSDPDKLLQILLNLLSNAVKFTETGEVRLVGRVAGDSFVFEVIDTGIGMDADHLYRIFDPFWQVERPITRRAGGTGLGLTISRRLADLVGAEIDVESTPNQGSTFKLIVPLD